MSSVNKIDDLLIFLNDMGINKDDICIVGSSILAALGIRGNNDLEFIVKPELFKIFEKKIGIKGRYWFQEEVRPGIDLCHNMYGICGVSDKTIFDKKLYLNYEGMKYIIPEIEYMYKIQLTKIMSREKDFDDIVKIEEAIPDIKKNVERNSEFYSGICKKKSDLSIKVQLFKNRMKNYCRRIVHYCKKSIKRG